MDYSIYKSIKPSDDSYPFLTPFVMHCLLVIVTFNRVPYTSQRPLCDISDRPRDYFILFILMFIVCYNMFFYSFHFPLVFPYV